MRKISILLILLPMIMSCLNEKEKKILGQWQGVTILEEGMPLDMDATVIHLEFLPNGCYRFSSTLNYRESGSFKVRDNLLYTLDTLNEASSEKFVMIELLTRDSLFLKMNEEGRERLLKLSRKN